jgi:hypothetical protein
VAGDGACVLTAPDGTIYKEYYGTGWQRGLTTLSEVWSGGVRQKWTTTAWTQDNTSAAYEVNPRVTETNVYDKDGNRRRTVIDYGAYAAYGLPYGVHEYAADGSTEIRQTFTDYNLSQAYLDRRIIGLVSQVRIANGAQSFTKITYDYDDPARLHGVPVAATQHDVNYNLFHGARQCHCRFALGRRRHQQRDKEAHQLYQLLQHRYAHLQHRCSRTPEQYHLRRLIL